MKIDLEVPSGECHNENRSNANFCKMDGIDGIDAQNVNFLVRSGNLEESCDASASGSVDGGELFKACRAEVDCVKDKRLNCEPQNGLEFESKEAAYHFYQDYARSVGFGITIKASRRSKRSGKFIDVKIACSRFGSKRDSNPTLNSRSCTKTGCKAGMHMKRREDDKWVIHNFVKEHNHEICADDFYNGSGGKTKHTSEAIPQKKGLQLALDEGDVYMMLEHFMLMQDENPGFFYALDLDNQTQLKNVFWVDAKARYEYSFFSDVVFLDTYYIKSKYRIPFSPFVGINHHCHYILLGGALIGEYSTLAFDWLMRTWRRAMGGKAPKVIVSDQDKFLSEVIAEVFPESRHCFCLWHVLSKIPDHMNGSTIQSKSLMEKFRKCIHCSWTEEQFERRWWKMVEKFNLAEDEVILSLYKDRKKWVPTFMKGTVLAGMSTTERTGSIASYFDQYMLANATFKEFITQYMTFLRERYEREAKADLETWKKQPVLKSLSPFEKQISLIYTETAFKKFQAELLGVVSCQLHKEREDEGATVILRVDDFEERQNFLVHWNKDQSDVCCSCHSFEYKGFLCKHAILVLQNSGLPSIPSHYILKRWSKDPATDQNKNGTVGVLHHRIERFNDLYKRAIKLGEMGSLSQEAYRMVLMELEDALTHTVDVNNSIRCHLEPNRLVAYGFLDTGDEHQRNSVSLKKKKIYKKKKVCPDQEGAINSLRGSCHQNMEQGNSIHNLDNFYISQQETEEMELGSREAHLDGYYVCQQGIHGAGQLNSISPIRDDYYGSQTAMQVMGQLHTMRGRFGHYMTQQSIQGMGDIGFRPGPVHGCFDVHDSLQDVSMDSSEFQSTASRHRSDTNLSR